MAKLVIGTSNQAVIPSIVKRVEVPIPTGKYSLLDRVVDDSNNSIGTVVGFHTDANNIEYAVVCLDAAYRLASGQYSSVQVYISGIPDYGYKNVYDAPETATTNCDAILATTQAQGYTSSAVSHCRAQTFTIDGVSYAGQLPTLMELLKIFEHRTQVNTADPTESRDLIISIDYNYWSSTQYSPASGWIVGPQGQSKTANNRVAPVLEIPNAL